MNNLKWIRSLGIGLVLSLFVTTPVWAADENEPTAGAMVADILVARPIGIVATSIGAVLFVVSLPFTALGGNVGKAGKALVVGPGKETFVRCLGCKTSGRYFAPRSE